MCPGGVRNDLYGRFVVTRGLQNFVELVGHKFRSANGTMQQCLIQQYAIARAVSSVKQLLATHPSLNALMEDF